MAGISAHACALLFLVNLTLINSLTFNVDPSKEECLFDDINLGVRVSGSFQVGGMFEFILTFWFYSRVFLVQVSTGGFLDIGVKVVV
jgi:hypothetical protein